MMKPAVPEGIKALADWEIMIGSLGLVFTLALFLLSGAFFSLLGFLLGLIILCLDISYNVSAFAFLKGKRWAWNLGMLLSVISLLISPVLLGPFLRLMFLPWVIVGLGQSSILEGQE